MRKTVDKIRIDFYREYRCGNSIRKSMPFARGLAIVCGVLCTVSVCVSSGFFLMRKATLRDRSAELDAMLISEERIAGIDEYDRISDENAMLTELNKSISEHIRPLAFSHQYRAYSPDLFLRINRLCGRDVTLVDISAEDYRFALVFMTDDASEISDLVKRIRDESIFSSVDYSGYTDVSDRYEFTLICTLSDQVGGDTDG